MNPDETLQSDLPSSSQPPRGTTSQPRDDSSGLVGVNPLQDGKITDDEQESIDIDTVNNYLKNYKISKERWNDLHFHSHPVSEISLM